MKLDVFETIALLNTFVLQQCDGEDCTDTMPPITVSGPWVPVFKELINKGALDQEYELTEKGLSKAYSLCNGINFKQVGNDYNIFALGHAMNGFSEGIKNKINKADSFVLHTTSNLFYNLSKAQANIKRILSTAEDPYVSEDIKSYEELLGD